MREKPHSKKKALFKGITQLMLKGLKLTRKREGVLKGFVNGKTGRII
jgi:hypothetical protein